MLPMSQVQTRTKLRPATKLNSFLRCLGWWLQTSLLSKHLHFIHVLLDKILLNTQHQSRFISTLHCDVAQVSRRKNDPMEVSLTPEPPGQGSREAEEARSP